jgi:ABC-type transport system substrate-binding protein
MVALVISAIVSSCTGSPPAAGPSGSANDPVKGGTLRIVWGVDVSLFDPATSGSGLARGLMTPVLQGLTQINPETGQIEPLLATKWESSNAGLTWRFTLKDGVKFQDGTAFNSETVVANVKRWLDPKFNHVTRSRLQAIKDATVVDPLTVEFTLSRVYPVLPNTLGEGFHLMLSQKDIKDYGLELGLRLPSGTGPFKVTSFVPGQSMTMERWTGYAGPDAAKVYLDKIEVIKVADNNARTSRLLAGEADLNLYQALPDVDRIKADPNLEIQATPSLRQWHFYFNTHRPQLADIRVRQALNYAFDQEALVKTAFRGFATVRYSLVPFAHLGAVDVEPKYGFNKDKAIELLGQAGWKRDSAGVMRNAAGDPLSIKLAYTTGGVYVADQESGQAAAGFWRAIGIQVREIPMDRATFYAVLVDKDSLTNNEVIGVPFQVDFQDGAAFLDLTYTQRSAPPACCNFGYQDNKTTLATIEGALAEPDTKVRTQKIQDAEKQLWQDVPAVPGPQIQLVAGKARKLHLTLRPNDLHPIAQAYFTAK